MQLITLLSILAFLPLLSQIILVKDYNASIPTRPGPSAKNCSLCHSLAHIFDLWSVTFGGLVASHHHVEELGSSYSPALIERAVNHSVIAGFVNVYYTNYDTKFGPYSDPNAKHVDSLAVSISSLGRKATSEFFDIQKRLRGMEQLLEFPRNATSLDDNRSGCDTMMVNGTWSLLQSYQESLIAFASTLSSWQQILSSFRTRLDDDFNSASESGILPPRWMSWGGLSDNLAEVLCVSKARNRQEFKTKYALASQVLADTQLVLRHHQYALSLAVGNVNHVLQLHQSLNSSSDESKDRQIVGISRSTIDSMCAIFSRARLLGAVSVLSYTLITSYLIYKLTTLNNNYTDLKSAFGYLSEHLTPLQRYTPDEADTIDLRIAAVIVEHEIDYGKR